MKHFLLLFLVLFALTLFPIANAVAAPDAASGQDLVWVAIRASDKGLNQPGLEYYGSVERKAFNTAVTSPVPTGFLKLTHASWLSDGKLVAVSESSYNGNSYGYKDVVYIRMDTIFRIIELSDEFTKTHFPPAK